MPGRVAAFMLPVITLLAGTRLPDGESHVGKGYCHLFEADNPHESTFLELDGGVVKQIFG
jgi:hypothetical protein